MSLRKQTMILGISPPYLNLLLNGKRPWRWHPKERYHELVTSTDGYALTIDGVKDKSIAKQMVKVRGVEPLPPCLQNPE